ncbi:Diacylglycerol O-acyltransferase 2 [Chamberlinius hualienensis]
MLTNEQLQTFAAFCLMRIVNFTCLLTIFFPFILFSNYCSYLAIIYYLWFFYSMHRSYHGGFRCKWIRNVFKCKPLRDYLPIHLIKTTPLDPNKNYIMGSHPHGIFTLGSFLNFNTEMNDFTNLFPGIKSCTVSLDQLLWVPILRDLLLLFGNSSSSRSGIAHHLENEGKGNVVIIVIGGIEELSKGNANEMLLVLRKRRGFVKVAITSGADLIPTITFGENEVFPTRTPTWLQLNVFQKLEDFIKHYLGLPFSYMATFNVAINALYMRIPSRIPVTTIVGKPIEVVKDPNPDEETISFYQNKYIESIEQLFNEYKVKLGDRYKDLKLKII